MNKKVPVLGTEYTITEHTREEDATLENCDGYCDKTSKTIVIRARSAGCDLDVFEVYQRKTMRHEIIHAFLFESGLHENWEHQQGHDETTVDWIASQYPKMKRAFICAGCDD